MLESRRHRVVHKHKKTAEHAQSPAKPQTLLTINNVKRNLVSQIKDGVLSDIRGVTITRFKQHADERGALTEVFREHWPNIAAPVQWNLVSSRPEVLRGFHVHVTHWDYLMCIEGSLFLGLKDIRPESPTAGRNETHILRAAEAAVTIPPGVAHGFYFSEPSKHLYGVTEYWNMADELGCAWNDHDIGITWPGPVSYLSPRDTQAGSFRAMTAEFLSGREAHQRRAS